MTKKMIENKIEELETKKFMLSMKDHWNREDFDKDAKLWNEIVKLRKELLN